jgi:hypothetical protein
MSRFHNGGIICSAMENYFEGNVVELNTLLKPGDLIVASKYPDEKIVAMIVKIAQTSDDLDEIEHEFNFTYHGSQLPVYLCSHDAEHFFIQCYPRANAPLKLNTKKSQSNNYVQFINGGTSAIYTGQIGVNQTTGSICFVGGNTLSNVTLHGGRGGGNGGVINNPNMSQQKYYSLLLKSKH